MTRHNDIEELLENPIWDEIKEELEKRQEALLSMLLKKDSPEAIEYKLITKLLNAPREKLDEMRAEIKEAK